MIATLSVIGHFARDRGRLLMIQLQHHSMPLVRF
jgi:hypothetical protein